jgi:hypothetical protein
MSPSRWQEAGQIEQFSIEGHLPLAANTKWRA